MTPSEINTKNWQLSISEAGGVVTGSEDIKQCIEVILTTRKGTDPLRPHFGCGVFDYIDKPVNTSIPAMKKEILEALRKFEPRIQVVSITAEFV